ncbi:DUF5924 family protein [Solimonas terrae]|uniref:DUF2914 domain-containing protein n=1 Tax=Solimonas terrae TaxID=1396819 RepID=A0A6M2BTN3_9GAMM|nr:DUF2914 domain-containing protein [Solimonas terrae]NGY05327.1 DUF2914 domain-containing protein [Solimonas terrae]
MTEAAASPGRLLQLWARYKHLVALCSFIAGAASLVLIQRQEKVAQTLVVLLPLSWLIAAFEPQWLKLAERARWLRHSPLLVRYLMQALHQESFFFTLPFFLATTTWSSAQPLFLFAMGIFALVSMIDPLYFDHVVVHRGRLWSFHAAAGFATVLAAAPMLWQITTATSLWLSIAAGAVLAVPAFAAALPGRRWLRWPAAITASLLLAATLSLLRFAIPPATLRVHNAHAVEQIDAEQRTPGPSVSSVSVDELNAHGLYAWTPIHAPRGLSEQIVHQWWHDGQLVDSIPIEIRGSREAGYRTWTHKSSFPADPRGDWQVRVVTQSDQLIGIVRFTVR